MNILGTGTCRKSRKGFLGDGSRLVIPSQSQWGTFKCLYNRQFHLIAARSKELIKQVGQNISTHECPEEITHYQDHIVAVDRGDQARLKGAGFCSKANYKSGTRKATLVLQTLAYSTLIVPGI
eukprot:14952618-Ditylum_brightwellii.AAC.2